MADMEGLLLHSVIVLGCDLSEGQLQEFGFVAINQLRGIPVALSIV